MCSLLLCTSAAEAAVPSFQLVLLQATCLVGLTLLAAPSVAVCMLLFNCAQQAAVVLGCIVWLGHACIVSLYLVLYTRQQPPAAAR
jgi:hypothetical protein